MSAMLSHITAFELPVVWLAFAAGLVIGIAGAVLVMRRRFANRES